MVPLSGRCEQVIRYEHCCLLGERFGLVLRMNLLCILDHIGSTFWIFSVNFDFILVSCYRLSGDI